MAFSFLAQAKGGFQSATDIKFPIMQKPLDGILVIALEQALAAPFASCRLADAGARVIKIEREVGDFARHYDSVMHGESAYFVWTNRGKESVVLDLKKPEDLRLLKKMLAKADVFIQNLAPGATQRLGIGSAQLVEEHPTLITVDITGYGETSYQDMKAYDFLVQSESGLVSVSGAPDAPGRIGVSIVDVGTGMNVYSGVLEALLLRSKTGTGSHLQVSMFDTAAEWMHVPLAHYEFAGKAPKPVGLHHPSIAPYGGYPTQDGIVLIAIQNNREWARFAEMVLGNRLLATDPLFATATARVANRPKMDTHITAVFSQKTRAEMMEILQNAKIAFASVNSVADLSEHPAIRKTPMSVGGETVGIVAHPVMMQSRDEVFAPTPALGEHTEAVRKEFS